MLLWILWLVSEKKFLNLEQPLASDDSFRNTSSAAKLSCAQGQELLVSDSLWL